MAAILAVMASDESGVFQSELKNLLHNFVQPGMGLNHLFRIFQEIIKEITMLA